MKQRTWQQVYERLDKRRADLGLSWKAVERTKAVSQRTMTKMRHDGEPLKTAAKRAALCRVLGWSPDSIDRLLRGDEPLPLDGATPADVRPAGSPELIAVMAEVRRLSEQVATQGAEVKRLRARLDQQLPATGDTQS